MESREESGKGSPMGEEPWCEEFFAGPWSKVQSEVSEELTFRESNRIERTLEAEAGARILDIPCGRGRHAIELGRRGYRMTGVDFNVQDIATARARAENAGIDAQFLVSDMRTFTSVEPFDAAFCYSGSFGYFTEEDDSRFLRTVAQALRSGGRFAVEGHIAETLLPVFRERDWFRMGSKDDPVHVLQERTWNLQTGRMEAVWTTIDESGPHSARSSMRIYTYKELHGLLESAGFTRVRALDAGTGEPLRVGSGRALFLGELADSVAR